jgi:hypothetical protein
MSENFGRKIETWFKEINKGKLLQLFGYLYRCVNDARSHKHQVPNYLYGWTVRFELLIDYLLPTNALNVKTAVCPPLHTRNILDIARYAAAPQPTNEVILLIFYKCSFSKERSVLPEDGRITETCSS